MLISDFQKAGWGSAEDAHFPEGHDADDGVGRLGDGQRLGAVGDVRADGVRGPGARRGDGRRHQQRRRRPTNVPVALSVDGHEIETKPATIAPHASTSVTFAAFTVAEANVRGTVRAGTDPLPADNTFHFVVSPSAPVSVAIVENGDRADASLYLAKALAIGTTPSFQPEVVPAARLTPAIFDKRSVVIFNDTVLPSAAGGGALKRFVERGGGVLVVAGERTSWLTEDADLLPGKLGAPVDRIAGPQRDARLSSTTATRSSKCSRRRAAATSRRRTCSAIARSRPTRRAACSRDTTMAPWRWRNGAPARAA